jgi:hypothetical protein
MRIAKAYSEIAQELATEIIFLKVDVDDAEEV